MTEKCWFAPETDKEIVCGRPSSMAPTNGVSSTGYGLNASVCTPGIGSQR